VNGGASISFDGSPVLGDKAISEPRQLDSKEKMTYTEQAAKRKHCQRLTRFEPDSHACNKQQQSRTALKQRTAIILITPQFYLLALHLHQTQVLISSTQHHLARKDA
jgi:hypothetical protein